MSEELDLDVERDAEVLAGYNDAPTETPGQQIADAIPEPKYRHFTEDEFNDVMTKVNAFDRGAIDKAFGKIGGLERALQQIQASTEAGQAIEVTDDDVAELCSEYQELGPMVKTTLQRLATKLRGTGAQLDPEKIHSSVDERLTERETATQAEEAAILDEDHPDWRDVYATQEFKDWLSTQSRANQRKFNRTWDADFLSDTFDNFKKFKEQEAALSAEKAGENTNTRQQRLKEAVTPRGTGGHAPAPDRQDDFSAGYHES